MSIRWGVSPIAWANDDMPELGGDTPLESVLADIRDVGFEGVELGGKFPREPAGLRPLLAKHSLALIGGWYSGSLLRQDASAEIAALQPHLRLLEAMGCSVFVFAETSNAVHGQRGTAMTATPTLGPGDWIGFGQRMTEVADHVQARGLRFAYHHHLGTVVESARDLDQFLRHTGASVGLTLDTGHAALGGIDPLRVIREFPQRVAHVHCKDVRREVHERVRDSGGSFLDGVLAGMFTVPGDGSLDYGAIMQGLAAIGYSGWIVIEAEQDPKLADPKQYAELGLRTLKARAAAAGLGVNTLRVRPHAPDASGTVLEVTPRSAGWKHVGFRVVKLAAGETFAGGEPDRETCLIVVSGSADVATDKVAFAEVGGRATPFESRPPGAVYVPAGTRYEVAARDAVELAVCTAPGSTPGKARMIGEDEMPVETRGTGTNTRYVRNILPQTRAADSLLVVEVLTPGGHWSSYPPHKHDTSTPEQETALEETYYHRLNPPQGFAFQRVYTDDRSLDETVCVEDGDVVMVPRGYHPVGAPHGYDLYYLNVMAGPRREWIFRNDPSHEWIVRRPKA